MLCLADTDIVLKLAACDLLQDALVCMNATLDDVRVLTSARHMLRKAKPGAFMSIGAHGLARAREFVERATPLPSVSNADTILLGSVHGIDPGEAALFAVTRDLPAFVLTTGDKRSLRALADAPACAHIAARMAGRVVCLEQVLLRLVAARGYAVVRAHATPVLDCDQVLKGAFGLGSDTVEAHTVEYLLHHLRLLRAGTGRLLWEGEQ